MNTFHNIPQLDGNQSLNSSYESESTIILNPSKNEIGLGLPTIGSYNVRSLFPKIKSFKIDIIDRGVDVAFVSEVWEQKENHEHALEIEKMLEINGLKYLSKSRPAKSRGGGVALIVNQQNFSLQSLDEVSVPRNVEAVWGLLRPKNAKTKTKFNKIIVCCFYLPPKSKRQAALTDHLIETLHSLSTKWPDSGIIMGADKNSMNLKPLLNSGLRLKQIVDRPTLNGSILDVLITNMSGFYVSPIIFPPIMPDNPNLAKPSDHSVPISWPRTHANQRSNKNWFFKTIRPVNDDRLREFGNWITRKDWDELSCDLPATALTSQFENILLDNLNRICPEKTLKIGPQDQPWMNTELKKLHRLKSREYVRKGKTDRYHLLSKEFTKNYKKCAKKFMQENVENLMDSSPSQAYATLKRLGRKPGDCSDSDSFSLPSHIEENLSALQSAERIADHFEDISKLFPPLDEEKLPSRVQTKLSTCRRKPPVVSPEETYGKICKAKKPRSTIPGELPQRFTKEFSVELATPLSRIINKVVQTADWPKHWKKEYITPIGKISEPQSESDLRPISLTPFFSKVAEHFVVDWLLSFIGPQIDIRQFGGSKGNSITHYLIEFINFILSSQENCEPTAVLACMLDFSQAFNRQNHTILVTKLSDMGVPAWLLKIVISFLKDRTMVVRFKGTTSSVRNLPGGGPQGTLHGLLLFLVLINDMGFENQSNNVGETITKRINFKEGSQLHLKFVDDVALLESLVLKNCTQEIPSSLRTRPEPFHLRTGHYLPTDESELFKQIEAIKKYTVDNDMKLNLQKTKLMLFNQSRSIDFLPELVVEDQSIEHVEEFKLLGVIFTSDLKFHRNTEHIVTKAYKRIWILKRLKKLGASSCQLINIYTKQIRSILELAVPAWHSSLTKADKLVIERVQKVALRIIFGEHYISYQNALVQSSLPMLEDRRISMCKKFAHKSLNHEKHSGWFKRVDKNRLRRVKLPPLLPVKTRTERFAKSPLAYLTSLLNDM